jgi:hypothetical protein
MAMAFMVGITDWRSAEAALEIDSVVVGVSSPVGATLRSCRCIW